MKPRVLFSCFALMTVLLTLLQAQPYAVADEKLIDGSLTPELIPDSVAYRMVLLSFSVPENATSQEIARQAAHLASLGIKGAEADAARTVLSEFRSNYTKWQEKQKNERTRGSRAFKNGLVQSTLQKLELAIGPKAMSAFSQYVQDRKKFMKTTEVQ